MISPQFLGKLGKNGVRLFDAVHLEELFETLANEQKDQPRINPRAKVREKT